MENIKYNICSRERWQHTLTIYTYIPIYLYTYIPIYLYTYIPIYLYTYIPIYLYTYIPIYLYTYVPIYLYIYIPIYLYTYIPIYLYTYISIYLYTYIPIYLYTYIPIYIPNLKMLGCSIKHAHVSIIENVNITYRIPNQGLGLFRSLWRAYLRFCSPNPLRTITVCLDSRNCSHDPAKIWTSS